VTVPLKTKVANFRCTPQRYDQIKKAMESMPWIESFTDLVERSLQAFLKEHVPLNGDLGAIHEPEKAPEAPPIQPGPAEPTPARRKPVKVNGAKSRPVSKIKIRLKKLQKKLQHH
jgi:hypothetical protein